MFGPGFKATSLFKIPVYLDWTILIAVAVLFGSLGVKGIAIALAVFSSVLIHEYAHAFAARRFGFVTERITLHYFGGAASIDLNDATPKQELLVVAAGPLCSAAIFVLTMWLDVLASAALNGTLLVVCGMALSMIANMNAIIAVFNLLPIFPMDGGRMLRVLLQWKVGRERATNISLNVALIFSAAMFVLAAAKLHAMLPIAVLLCVVTFLLKRENMNNKEIGI